MQGIEQSNKSSRVSELCCLLNGVRTSLSYQKIQEHSFKLSILKLDDSSFGNHRNDSSTFVPKRVASFTFLVSLDFSKFSDDDDYGIQLQHMFTSREMPPLRGSKDRWRSLLLAHRAPKGIEERISWYESKREFHASVHSPYLHQGINNFGPLKWRPEEGSVASRWRTMYSSGSNAYGNNGDGYINEDDESSTEDEPCHYERHQVTAPKFKLARFLTNRFSCSKLKSFSASKRIHWQDLHKIVLVPSDFSSFRS